MPKEKANVKAPCNLVGGFCFILIYTKNCIFVYAGNGLIKNKMSQKLRAKFICESITDFGYQSKQVKLRTVYCNKKNTENNQFSQATPSGEMSMMVTAEGAQKFFEPGKSYYLDFELAEE